MKQLRSADRQYIMVVLKANLLFLATLVVIAPFVPLSITQRGFVMLFAALLTGFNWALIAHAKKRQTPPD